MPGFKMRLSSVVFAVTLIGAALVCGTSGVSASASQNYTDQEVVEAVLFGVGPMAKELGLPEIPAELEAEHDAHRQEIPRYVDRIELRDPVRYERAVRELRSGDPFAVERGATYLHSTLLDIVKEDTGVDPLENREQCGAFFVCVAAMYVAIVGAAVMVYFAAIEVGAHTALAVQVGITFGEHSKAIGGDLRYEDYIARITAVAKD